MAAPSPNGRPVDFARAVFPVLEARCFDCHGPDQQKAGLRLDARTTAMKGGKSGPAIQPGDAAGSRLFRRVSTADTDEAMPPKGERLTPEQQAFAFFNQTRDGGKALEPVLELPTPEQAAQRAALRAKIDPLQKVLDTQTPDLDAELAHWEAGLQEKRRASEAGWQVVEPSAVSASHGVRLERQPGSSSTKPTPTSPRTVSR